MQRACQQLSQQCKQQDRTADADQQVQKRRHRLFDLLAVDDLGCIQLVHQLWVAHVAGDVDVVVLFIVEQVFDLLVKHFHLLDIALCKLGGKGAVIHLYLLSAQQSRKQKGIEQQHDQQRHHVIVDQRLSYLWIFYFIHRTTPLSSSSLFKDIAKISKNQLF